jgi:DNA invertase Pin-like site-specific DNA recombinase
MTVYGYARVSTNGQDLSTQEAELMAAKRAKDRGVRFGRPSALTASQRQEALQRLADGNAQGDVARTFNVSQATISRLAGAAGA